jgi:hypothetical protein
MAKAVAFCVIYAAKPVGLAPLTGAVHVHVTIIGNHRFPSARIMLNPA